MGCGQSKITSKPFNLRKPKLEEPRQDAVVLSNNSPVLDDRSTRQSEERTNVNHVTSGSAKRARLKKGQGSSTNSENQPVITKEEGGGVVESVPIPGGETEDASFPTSLERSLEYVQEKQARYAVTSSYRPSKDVPNRLTSNQSNLTASQIEFFRMVDEKIAQGKEYQSDDER